MQLKIVEYSESVTIKAYLLDFMIFCRLNS